jgi:hypothetical protein
MNTETCTPKECLQDLKEMMQILSNIRITGHKRNRRNDYYRRRKDELLP